MFEYLTIQSLKLIYITLTNRLYLRENILHFYHKY